MKYLMAIIYLVAFIIMMLLLFLPILTMSISKEWAGRTALIGYMVMFAYFIMTPFIKALNQTFKDFDR